MNRDEAHASPLQHGQDARATKNRAASAAALLWVGRPWQEGAEDGKQGAFWDCKGWWRRVFYAAGSPGDAGKRLYR